MSRIKDRDGYKNMENLNWVSWMLVMFAITFILLSLVPFFINPNPLGELVDSKPLGDTFSDIMAPFVSIASVSMMFLAFYMQFRANKLVIKQFERNQFENRFFELLKMHKNNAADVLESFYAFREIKADNDPEKVNGRRRFEYIVTGLNDAYNRETALLGEAPYDAREVFTRVWSSRWEDSFGHYFRHLFMLVRFVVSKNFLTYEQKRSYLRILRTSLSTWEQAFLYYDWISGDGCKWEDENNRFFTDYRMIHNIDPKILLPDFDIRTMSPFRELMANEDYLQEKDHKNDNLFEFESRPNSRI